MGSLAITVEVPDDQVNVTASDDAASEEGPDAGSFTISRLGDTSAALNVLFTMSGSATPGSDYTLSHGSPVTIPAGQGSVVVTLTPDDDSEFGEGDETAILTITPDAAYPIGLGTASITIADNDNNAPEVDAGTDQTIYLDDSQAWTPASITTAAWYDAADSATITHSSGAVSQWSDKSGNNRHATQTSASIRPVTGSRTIGGKNAMGFAASSSQAMNMPTLDLIGKESWAVFVLDSYATTDSQLILGGGGNVQIGVNSSTAKLRCWAATNPYSADTTSTATVPVATPTVAGWLAHTDTKKFSINGGLETTTNTYISPRTLSPSYIGRGQYAYLDGAIGEIIITGGQLSTDDRQKMEGYLAHKWGLDPNLPSNHPHKQNAPGQAEAVANLNGSGTDADGNPMTYLWTDTGTGTGTGDVVFSNPASLTSTVSFTAPGTFILRLTADDGMDQTSDDITITVMPPPSAKYTTWAGKPFASTFTITGPDQNPDGDLMNNWMEFAFGTDPTVQDGGALASDGSAHGLPLPIKGAGDAFELYFVRRDDHGTPGSIDYTVQFSSNLVTFYDSAVPPTFVADSSADSDYEVVKVAYPASLPDGQQARFGRIMIREVE